VIFEKFNSMVVDFVYSEGRVLSGSQTRVGITPSPTRVLPPFLARSWVAIHFARTRVLWQPNSSRILGAFIARVMGSNPRASLTAGHSSRLLALFHIGFVGSRCIPTCRPTN